MKFFYTWMDSPIGCLLLTTDGAALTGLYMHKERQEVALPGDGSEQDTSPALLEARRQLGEYFIGERTTFDLPLKASGTDFQQRVWAELEKIPYGVTISYGELAKRLGDANASRAVGLANGRNPISVIIPCHRVIGASGKLTGYGGGLPRKQALLDFERMVLANGPTTFSPLY